MRGTKLVAGAALLALMIQPAAAKVWIFGDSNVDTGWFLTAPYSGEVAFDVYLSDSSLHIGRQTNNPGPMSVEVLAGLLGVTAIPANRGGTNFATSGAKNYVANTTGDGFPNAVPTVAQIQRFLQTHGPLTPILSGDVFVIDSGANDISHALGVGGNQDAYLQLQARNLVKAIAGMQSRGAAHIIVTNQPESFGTLPKMMARHTYNTALRGALDAAHVSYAWGDADSVRLDIVQNVTQFSKFNILYVDTNVGHTACKNVSNFASDDWAILCSSDSPVAKPDTTVVVLPDLPVAEVALFADPAGHWSASAQRILGEYYYCLVRITWPTLVVIGPRPPRPCNQFRAFGAIAATQP